MRNFNTLTATIAALGLGGCASQGPSTDQASCAIYRSFYDAARDSSDDETILVGVTSNMLIESDGGAAAAPTRFETGGDLFVGSETPRPTIDADTSDYFEQVRLKPGASLRNCFDADAPHFIDADAFRQSSRMGTFKAPGAVVYRFSPVAFSSDKQYALLVADWSCDANAPCGAGAYFLFARLGEAWTLVGVHDLWVS